MIDVELDAAAARRLLAAVVATATGDRKLTPARAGQVTAIATQLGLDFQDVAAATGKARRAEPASRSEAEATYLVAAVLVRTDGPSTEDKAALEVLGVDLDLGVATRELDRIAREEVEPLSGLKPASKAEPKKKRSGSASDEKKPATDTRKGKKQGVEESRSKRRGDAAEKKDDAGAEPAKGKRPAGGPIPGLPPWALPAGIGGAVVTLLLLGFLLSRGGAPPPPPVVAGPNAPPPAAGDGRALKQRYTAAVERWNTALKANQEVPLGTLEELQGELEGVRQAAQGTAGAEALARDVTDFLRGDFQRERERAVEATKTQLEDELQFMAQDGLLEKAKAHLDRLPAGLASTTWAAAQKKKVDAWRAYSIKVEAFLNLHSTASGLKDLREAQAMHRQAGEARVVKAHAQLSAWFTRQRSHSDAVCLALFEAAGKGRPDEVKELHALLQMIETDFQSFLAKKSPEELKKFIAALEASGGLPPAPAAQSTGTGFYVGPRHILTNHHVVGEAKTVRVEAAGGPCDGKVLALDRENDLALVEVPLAGEPLAMWTKAPTRGLPVFAWGYGVLDGDASTLLLTRGAISALQPTQLVFDAKVNPGNSGGPLVDADGRWVGVVVAKSRADARVESLGFAVAGVVAERFLALQSITPLRDGAAAKGTVPAEERMKKAVVRIVVGAPAPPPAGGRRR